MPGPKGTYSFLTPVEYKGVIKAKVDAFNKQPKELMTGSLWGATAGGDMEDVKKFIKDHYKVAQDYKCSYCQQRIEVNHNGAWDAEHIIPKDSHPQFMFEPRNLCISCKDCNLIKLNKPVLKNKTRSTFADSPDDYLICHPHFHEYSQHINIIQEAGFYLPRTPVGVMLVEVCGLLRFVLKYADCEWDSEQLAIQIHSLGGELISAAPSARFAIMAMMRTLLDEGLRKAALLAISARVDKFAAA